MEIRESRGDAVTRDLDEQERSALLQVVKNTGWPVILMLMERECIQQETNLLNVAPEDSARIIAEHHEAQAFWRFYVRIQKRIAHEVGELLSSQIPTPQATAEEREVQSIVEPWAAEQE